jgi:hypothetical protein
MKPVDHDSLDSFFASLPGNDAIIVILQLYNVLLSHFTAKAVSNGSSDRRVCAKRRTLFRRRSRKRLKIHTAKEVAIEKHLPQVSTGLHQHPSAPSHLDQTKATKRFVWSKTKVVALTDCRCVTGWGPGYAIPSYGYLEEGQRAARACM